MLTASLPSLAFLIVCAPICAAGEAVEVSSLAELAQAAAGGGRIVTMRPGIYRVSDHIPLEAIPGRRVCGEWQFLTFGGSHNVFRLNGVTIEVDTALRAALRAPIHTDEILVSGSSNEIVGLTITHVGDGASMGGAALGVTGDGNTLRDCTLRVRGSFPYGYGDLFGKGGSDVIGPRKKSGVHITGDGTRLLGCRLHMGSFGHGFYIQEDAADIRFENCHVEGVMRSTDDMLAETSGPASEIGFRTVAKNRLGENRVTPGYMKALSEDGFRTYGQHRNLSFKDCTARNMRAGFELRSRTSVRLEGCVAIGCERGYWVSGGATLVRCRGDARYGPLLFVEGDGASLDLELDPAESPMNVHALATIQGGGHKVTIRQSSEGVRARPAPIMIGFGAPGMGEGMSPIPEKAARDVALRNETAMPVVIGARASGGEVLTRGPIQENRGKDIKTKSLSR